MRPKYMIGIISGFFNPIHAGHIDYIKESSQRCNLLYVIVNNDKQQLDKIGKIHISCKDRIKVVDSIKYVYSVVEAIDDNESVSKTIDKIYKDNEDIAYSVAFFNSGDRTPENENSKEAEVCSRLGIKMEWISSPKVDSSTRLRGF